MAVSVVAVSSQTVYTTTGAKSQSYPYTPVAGDVAIHYQGGRWTRSLATNGFAPTGYTFITSHYRSATPDVVGAAYYRVLDGSESSIDFTIGASGNPVATITIILRGVDNTTVVESSAVQNAGAATTFQMNSHTTTVANEFCLRLITSSASNGNLSLSTVNSWTTNASGSSYDATGVSQHVHSKSIASSGTASLLTVTSGASGAWVGLRVSFDSSPLVSGSSAVSQDGNTSSAAGELLFTGSLAVVEADDASSASGSTVSATSGTAAVTQDGQTSSATGLEVFTGSSAATNADDMSTASGALAISGSSAVSQTSDTSSASGVEVFAGTVAVTGADNTSSATSTVTISGTAAASQDAQSASASGELVLSGSAAVAQADDTAAGSASVELIGSASPAQADDASAASGSVGGVDGSAAITQADDSAAGSAELVLEGAASSVGGDDTAAAFAELIISGVVGVVADDDSAAAAGGLVLSGSAAIVQAADTAGGAVLAGRTRVFDVGLVLWRAGHVKRWDGVSWVEDFRVKVFDGVSAWVEM